MAIIRRIGLFVTLNLLVLLSISILLEIVGAQRWLFSNGINFKLLGGFCMLWGFGGALISLSLSRLLAKWTMGVRVINTEKVPQSQAAQDLLQLVRSLSQKAGLKTTPEIGVYESAEINAFATGPTKKKSLIALSSGLLGSLNKNQLSGVLAHEIAHIANGDMVTMTLLQGVVNSYVMFFAQALAYVISGRVKEESRSMVRVLSVYAFEIAFMIFGSVLIAAYSRQREFRADSGGAKIVGSSGMIETLQGLNALGKIKDKHHKGAALRPFKISAASSRRWLAIFSTHPPLDVRIERLPSYA